jgi:F-type H+-transporting ATPase subunit a
MTSVRVKSLVVGIFSLFLISISGIVSAQENHETVNKDVINEATAENKSVFDANEVIFGHIMDAHEFHFLTYKGSDGHDHHVSIPLPVLLYSPEKGFSFFNYSKFHHGEHEVDGYKLEEGHIVPVDPTVTVYDISFTRNVVQMLIAMFLLMFIMISVGKHYKRGQGVKTAPKGFQSVLEPVVTFIRDEVAKPNLGHKYEKFLPFILTLFFFILINNLFGLIPGSANVTGNIAFTMVLAVVTLFVILFSSNKHFWGHIFWYPGVPVVVRLFIMLPVELLGVFTKPFALMIRLFANMMAGHIIIICLISLIFIFGALSPAIGWGFSPISIAFSAFIYMIEVLVAFIQAFIFANLAAVFIGQAFEGEHAEHH